MKPIKYILKLSKTDCCTIENASFCDFSSKRLKKSTKLVIENPTVVMTPSSNKLGSGWLST